jgi:hypothetical protein
MWKSISDRALPIFYLAVILFVADAPAAGRLSAPTIAEAFVGEELVYSISFWLFDDIATGRIRLDADADGYVATLSAETTGVVGWLLSYRKDTYVSRMRLSSDGQRFISRIFEKTVDKKGKVRSGVTTIDHAGLAVSWISWGGGKDTKTGGAEIPEGIYIDDALTAFYNYRYGSYGAREVGREVRIPTIPKNNDRIPEIELRITGEDEKNRRLPPGLSAVEFLADVIIDKDLFGQKAGEFEVFFGSNMVPRVAVAKDVAMFGDLTGRLIETTSTPGVSKPVPAPLQPPDPADIEAAPAEEPTDDRLAPDIGY